MFHLPYDFGGDGGVDRVMTVYMEVWVVVYTKSERHAIASGTCARCIR